jgi:hypothetical protein
MTTLLNQLADEVTMKLSGYTLQQDRSTYLKEAITTLTSSSASPLIIKLGSTDSVGKGTIEIDEELFWVDSFDRVANTATIAPYGRGYLGTAPATHALDTKVTISPTFPRFAIKKAINDTIQAIGSQMFSQKSTTFTFNIPQNTYGFNNLNIKNIISIMWQSVGPTKEWIPVRRYTFDTYADATTWGTGAQTITINDFITPGRTVKIVYGTDGAMLDGTENQTFEEITGYQNTVQDVVVLGAMWRLLTSLDPARASMNSPQADETDSKRPYGSSGTAVKQIYALYQQRLQEEVLEQQRHFPVRVHYAR